MAAITLLEASKLLANSGKYFESAVVEMFATSNNVMRYLPFQTIQGSALQYNREGSLPSVAFRGVNESFTPSTGVINPLVEPLRISGGEIDVDKFIIRNQGESVRVVHERMKIKALMQDFQRAFFKGDSSTNAKEFDGLQNRLTGDQVISNKRAESPAGGEVLSLNKLDEAIDAVANPTHIFMSKGMKRRMSAAQRNTSVGGNINYTTDEFGKQVMLYSGIPVIAIEDAEGKDTVLTFTEAASDAGGSSVNTSIYVVSLGDMMLTGIQGAAQMQITDLGELQSAPVYRTRVEWDISIALWHGRCAARLRDIIDGAVVA